MRSARPVSAPYRTQFRRVGISSLYDGAIRRPGASCRGGHLPIRNIRIFYWTSCFGHGQTRTGEFPMSSADFVRKRESTTTTKGPVFLMCSPELYEVNYVINPWMEGNINASSKREAGSQWEQLYSAVSQFARIELVEPQPGS